MGGMEGMEMEESSELWRCASKLVVQNMVLVQREGRVWVRPTVVRRQPELGQGTVPVGNDWIMAMRRRENLIGQGKMYHHLDL